MSHYSPAELGPLIPAANAVERSRETPTLLRTNDAAARQNPKSHAGQKSTPMLFG
ncbi:hypothetical protein [Accumulibacter sp.]|uniref:hypothetical protein n=1 Tax=Accumulibacter sp. TaxID=2053492 RepID=UPI002610A0F6|nr:hypothetical protein [Accumulibacter sp.]